MKDSDYIKTNSANLLHLILNKADASIKESNGNKYLIFADADKNKELVKKHTKPWHEIKYHIKIKNAGKHGEYGKDYMKIKLNSDDDLPFNKILKLHNLTIVVRSVFKKMVNTIHKFS